ncbi:MAG: hypothetical protein ACFBSF_14560 [Leptolyngbyaceae cyanobacterium]
MTQLPIPQKTPRFLRALCLSTVVSLFSTLGIPSFAGSLVAHSLVQTHSDIQTVADEYRAYVPPSDSRLPEDADHTGAATRDPSEAIAVLAPRLHVGRTLSTRPTLSEDALQMAQAYASAGFWYDAMAAVHDASTPEAKALRQDLLLDLADLEDQPNLDAQLREIASQDS